jgi:preprotein translocase subunit SecF
MYIIKHRTLFFSITGFLLAAAIGAIAFFGLPLSIDFTGGSLVEVRYIQERPSLEELTQNVEQLALGNISLRESGTDGIILRTRTLSPAEHTEVLQALGNEAARGGAASSTATTTTATTSAATFVEERFNSIGPSLGNELALHRMGIPPRVTTCLVLGIWGHRRHHPAA